MSDAAGSAAEKLERLFLEPSGWIRSRLEAAPLGPEGEPLPWFTYGAIEFLQRIVRPSDRVFEFGAGYSTLWWQQKVRSVVTVEHDGAWITSLQDRLQSNVDLKRIGIDAPVSEQAAYRTKPFFSMPRRTKWAYDDERVVRRGLDDDRFVSYAHAITDSGGVFDFVIVDGMARRLCVYLAIEHVAPDGFLVLDNSNRSDYDVAYLLLNDAGFRQLPFWGLVPGADFMTCTSFFTRSLSRLPAADHCANHLGLPEY